MVQEWKNIMDWFDLTIYAASAIFTIGPEHHDSSARSKANLNSLTRLRLDRSSNPPKFACKYEDLVT
jgi:hypothetical protein